MDILIGKKYQTEFESAFRLIESCPAFTGYSVSGDVEGINYGKELIIMDGKNIYTFDETIENAQFRDDDDDDTDDEIGFSIDGASWFRGMRGVKNAESADAQWMRFIEKIALAYHAKYSIVEYKQQKSSKIDVETAYDLTKKIIKFLFPQIELRERDFIKVTDEKILQDEALDIYGLNLRLALSGGTGQSERVLGKVYFNARNNKIERRLEMQPMLKNDASNVDATLSALAGEDSDGDSGTDSSDAYIEMLGNNALGALEALISGGERNFVDCFFSEARDQAAIADMLSRTAHNRSELQCDELKVLGISHIQWRTTVYDCVIGGTKKLRVVFGLNNSLTLKCLNCGTDEPFFKDNTLYLETEKPTDRYFITFPDTSDEETMGLSAEDVTLAKERGKHLTHFKTVKCDSVNGLEGCKCVRCASQLFTVTDERRARIGKDAITREYCRDCRHPEIVYYDLESDEPQLTSTLRFAINTRRMEKMSDELKQCSLCDRFYVMGKGEGKERCSLCELANKVATSPESVPEDMLAEARALYRSYAEIIPVFKRMGAGKNKYCFEDEAIIVFVVGKNIYHFSKLSISERGFIAPATKNY